MKISLEWLKDYVNVTLPPVELADLLTHSGLEVESLTRVEPEFRGVVVALLDSFRRHPKSDHLSICRVTDGKRDYSIVCGAPNVKAGERVALAVEGAVLPGGEKIGRNDFQGVLSEGMLCSEKELGLTGEASGIMILDDHLPLGTPLERALPLEDWVLEVNITPNRSDCLCLLGIAREVAALTGQRLRLPEIPRIEGVESAEGLTSVTLDRADLCPRYVAKLILGIKIAPSPFWMRRRLEAQGVRGINNIVDVTNYVMLEMGQPLHAFDFDQLEEKRIVVRTAPPGQAFTTLDGVSRSMPPEALMICDGKKPVALAGIMGGLNSEVQPETVNILLESAYFEPMGVRRTSKRLGLGTEASIRFERGIDPNGSLRAAERAAGLMAELGKGAVARGAVDNYPLKIAPREIRLRIARVNQILGTVLDREKVENYLGGLEMAFRGDGEEALTVTPATYRVDLTREIDLIEEVARLHGFHRIPTTLPKGRVCPEKKTRIEKASERAKNLMASFGFWEVITYSFMSPQAVKDLGIPPGDRRSRALPIQNPLGEDQSVMRTSLLPGLLHTARTNTHRQNFNLKFFELGRVFFPGQAESLPEEVETLSGLLSGLREEESWARPKAECDFFDLKGVLEGLLDGMGLAGVHFLPDSGIPFLHPGKSCRVEAAGESLGVMGELNSRVNEIYDLKQRVFLFELDFQKVSEKATDRRVFTPLPRYPAVTRDLALVVDDKIAAGDLLASMWKVNEGLIKEIRIFDLYQGSPVPAGKKSVAFRLIYQREDRTLTDQEVNVFHDKVVQLLAREYGGTLR